MDTTEQEQRLGEHQYRVRCDKPMPEGWPWEEDLNQVEEEAEVMRSLGFTGVRIEVRLTPQPWDTWEITHPGKVQ